jgi:hypothetical protein
MYMHPDIHMHTPTKKHIRKHIQIKGEGAGEMTQQLREPVALSEDWSWVHSVHVGGSSSRELMPSPGILEHTYTHSETYICIS